MKLEALRAVVPRPPIPPIRTREELIDALGRAAEIEHAIMCQYLYAAFSLDRTSPALSPEDAETVRGFAIDTLRIARQEMEHLGLVANLLIAVGASPNFDRPNLPLPPFYYQLDLPLALLPFGDEFLDLAERLERPCEEPDPHPPLPYYPSVAAVYERLREGLAWLGSPASPIASTLFLGAADPQLSNADFGLGPGQVWYEIELIQVTDLTSALAAIDLIRVQGEGAAATDPCSHHALVCRMQQQWARLSSDARAAMLRPIPRHPQSQQRGDVHPDAALCVLSDDRAVALARLGNRVYELILLLLARLYGVSDATAADRDMYRTVAFFPLMTCVVRPLGEILTELPAGDGEHCAVFTFEIDGPIRAYPDRDTFHVQLGERLTHLAGGLAGLAAAPDVPPRLGFVAKNVAYIRERVLAYVRGEP